MARIKILTTDDTNILLTAAAIVADIQSITPGASQITILGDNGDSIVLEGTNFQFDQGIPSGGVVTKITLKDGPTSIAEVDQFSAPLAGFDFSDGIAGLLDLAPNINFLGNAGDDVGFGATGDDTVRGAGGDDTLTGFSDNDHLAGDAGDDLLIGLGGKDSLFGGAGNDILKGGNGADHLNGGAGDDNFEGGKGKDFMTGLAGKDTADYSSTGNSANTVNLANTGFQKVGQAAGNDKLVGIENLIGGNGDDNFTGNVAANKLEGRGGDDTLTGGFGADSLYGGADDDTFVYGAVGEVKGDRIFDFGDAGDRIDLSAIDATGPAPGDQFSFIGTDSFNNVKGELRFSQSGGVTSVEGDINGDGNADFTIQLMNGHTPTESDFIL